MANIGTDKGGRSFQDRVLAAEVRSAAVTKIKAIVKGDKRVINTLGDYQKQMLLKLAPTLLPRLNEHTGEDGAPVKIDMTLSARQNLWQGHLALSGYGVIISSAAPFPEFCASLPSTCRRTKSYDR